MWILNDFVLVNSRTSLVPTDPDPVPLQRCSKVKLRADTIFISKMALKKTKFFVKKLKFCVVRAIWFCCSIFTSINGWFLFFLVSPLDEILFCKNYHFLVGFWGWVEVFFLCCFWQWSCCCRFYSVNIFLASIVDEGFLFLAMNFHASIDIKWSTPIDDHKATKKFNPVLPAQPIPFSILRDFLLLFFDLPKSCKISCFLTKI